MGKGRRGLGADLALLTRRPDLPATQRLLQAAAQLSLSTVLVDDRRCHLLLDATGSHLWMDGALLPTPRALLARASPSFPSFSYSVLRTLGRQGTFLVNPPSGIARARNKLRTAEALVRAGLPMVPTAWPSRNMDLDALVDRLGGTPIVLKTVGGSQGMGVCRADSPSSARSIIEAFFASRVSVLLQPFIASAQGRDLRAFVVGDRVVACMERIAPSGEFRANLHRGALCVAHSLNQEGTSLAVAAARAVGLSVAGVDLLWGNGQWLVLEVNASPGLTGIEGATGLDVAREVVHWIASQAGLSP